MLGENIKTLRKRKGYSQEILAQQLHVVRQTVSKWEKGISVPDAELLNRISELFEVPVSQLLGGGIPEQAEESDITEVAKQLAVLNEQFANAGIKRRTNLRRAAIGVSVAAVAVLILYMFFFWNYRVQPRRNAVLSTTTFECTLDGQLYLYEVVYDEQHRIIEAGGDAWIANHVLTEQYSDADILEAQIEDYFKDRGGSCKVIKKER